MLRLLLASTRTGGGGGVGGGVPYELGVIIAGTAPQDE